jgi:hypothetical protein
MLISLLSLVGILTENNPAELADTIQNIHHSILAPDQQREISRKNLPLLRPTLMDYIQTGQAICQCQFDKKCVETNIKKVQQYARQFKNLMYNIRPSLLTNAQQIQYDAIKAIVPDITRMPMACVESQNTKNRVENYYKQPRLDFFLKELRIATQNTCSCNDNEICQRKTKTLLSAIYQNINTTKLTNHYSIGMWLTYDAISKICLSTPNAENNKINIPDALLISNTVFRKPTLTLQEAREYVGFDVTITRKDGREDSGILLAMNNDMLALSIRNTSGSINSVIPIQSVAKITATKPKEQI